MKVTIKRITPPVSNRRVYGIKEILKAADKVRRAMALAQETFT